jgi:transcriptional regulator with XRE-family HTH domain
MEGWTFGLAVSTARKMSGKTQQELADQLDWSPYRLSRIENDQTPATVADLRALALVQGMPYGWYMDGPQVVDLRSGDPVVSVKQ